MPQNTKLIGLVAATLAFVSCETISKKGEQTGGNRSSSKSSEIIVDIDPFYSWGKYPKVRLQGKDAIEIREIINSAPKLDLKQTPTGMTVSPTPGLSVIEDRSDFCHIMSDCEIVGRKLSPKGRLKLFRILSKHTTHFRKPKP